MTNIVTEIFEAQQKSYADAREYANSVITSLDGDRRRRAEAEHAAMLARRPAHNAKIRADNRAAYLASIPAQQDIQADLLALRSRIMPVEGNPHLGEAQELIMKVYQALAKGEGQTRAARVAAGLPADLEAV